MGAELIYTETQAQAHTLNRLNDKSADLVTTATGIQNDMDRLVKTIHSGFSVNSLGELQSRGSRLDILCAERQLLADQAKMIGCETEHINLASVGMTGDCRSWFMGPSSEGPR